MKPYKLFLDDMSQRKPSKFYKNEIDGNWNVVRNYDEFVRIIEFEYERGYFPEVISFDHDLAEEHYYSTNDLADIDCQIGYRVTIDELGVSRIDYKEKTGLDCAKWLIQFCLDKKLDLPICFVHSLNPVGRKNIQDELNSFQRQKEIYERK